MIAAGTSEFETFDYNIFEGFKNSHNQKLVFESRGSDIVISIEDGEKKCEFIIEYKNRLLLEDLKRIGNQAASIATKHSGNIVRVGN